MQRKVSTCMLVDEALVGVSLSDRISVPSKRVMTDAGQMHVPCKFARTGSQLYTAGQLGLLDEDPKKIIEVFRDETDVFDEESMESFRSAPVTLGHPKDESGAPIPVTAENSKELQVGMLEGMPTRDEDTLGGMLILTAKEAIDALEEGTQELSAGYTCDIHDVDGKYFQRNIRANHIAIVDKGRAGSSCRISDEALEVQEAAKEAEVLGPKVVIVTSALADAGVEVEDGLTFDEAIEKFSVELKAAQAKVAEQAQLVDELKTASEEADVAMEQLKVQLADAVVAAEEGVVERCEAIENARLIADMRDLGSKSVAEIHRMVVEDQMPEKNLEGKSEAYISAMFEILVDASKGETPMGKLMKQQESHIQVDSKAPIDPVAESRRKMIERNKKR